MLTIKELAEKLNVCTKTIDNMVKKGMPCLKVGSVKRFDYDEVMKWLKENQ